MHSGWMRSAKKRLIISGLPDKKARHGKYSVFQAHLGYLIV